MMNVYYSLLLLLLFFSLFLNVGGTAVPSQKPTVRPTFRPTLIPTVSPSTKPSRKPTSSPTSPFPTSHPTANPTAHPTAHPTANPTAHPTALPTHPTPRPSASMSPSKQPTPRPTRSPTIKPSTRPTCKPSLRPSRRPSRFPTSHPSSCPSAVSKIPTARPTKRESSSLIFTSNITLEGVFTTDLKSSDQNAIISATALSMNISFTSVIFLGDILQIPTDDYWDTSNIPMVSSTLIARTRTSVLLPPDSDPVVLWTHLTSLLKTAVNDGIYTKHLQAACTRYGSVSLVNVEATSVTISPAVEMSVDSSSHSKAIYTGGIIGIAIGGAAALLAVIIAIGLCTYCNCSSDATSAPNSRLETAVIAVPVDTFPETIPSAPEQPGGVSTVIPMASVAQLAVQSSPQQPPEIQVQNQQQQQISLRKGEEILL